MPRSLIATHVAGVGLTGVLLAGSLSLLAGCSFGPGTGPAAVQPTLDAARALGLTCDSGEKDNVPSGLYQWQCRDRDQEVAFAILINGNDAGVAEIDLITPTNDTALMRAAIAKVVPALPPLAGVETLAADAKRQLDDWNGEQRFVGSHGLRIAAECLGPSQFGNGQCVVHFVGSDPVKPMLR